MVRLTIAFCTFHREKLLLAALQSVCRMDGLDRAAVDIVVADNSDGETARATVAAFATGCPLPVHYITAHPANISIARNAAAASGAGEIIAFLDDDMQLERGWLDAVLDAVAATDHDAYFGPVAPVFEAGAAVNPHAVAMFTRGVPLAPGATIYAGGRLKTHGFAVATSNSIYRRARTFTDAQPFDPAFGHAGGEDLDLFVRLENRGLRFGWIPDAKTTEFVPAHRCDPAYLARRYYCGAQVYAAVTVRNSLTPKRTAASIVLRAAVQAVMLGAAAPALLLRGKAGRMRLAMRRASVAGKLGWRRLMPLYRDEQAALSAAKNHAAPVAKA